MIKNIIISALAAGVTVDKLSRITDLTVTEQAALWITFAWILIIFCVFLDGLAEKMRKRRLRVRQLGEILEMLRREGGTHYG